MESYSICCFVTGIMPSRFIHFVACDMIYFLWLNNIVCVCTILFTHSSVNRHLGCFPCTAFVKSTAVNTGAQISLQDTAFNFLDIHPEVGLLDHRVILFLYILRKLHILFSIAVASLYNPNNGIYTSNFSTSSPVLVTFWAFLTGATLMCVR